MGLFDDPSKLYNTSFGWALTSYSEEVDDGPPPDSSRLVVFIDEEGVLNTDGKIMLFPEVDPIDAPGPPEFTKSNQFVEGLKKVINPFPVNGIILYPTIDPGSVEVLSEGGFFGTITAGGSEVRFPNDTPEGFVPCAGQVLEYPGGVEYVVPNLASRTVTGGAGDGAGTSVVSYAPPGSAYMIKVPDGWSKMTPDLTGKNLGDISSSGMSLF